MGQVRIGREFFQNAAKDYRDANWAVVREFMQNCIDAPGSGRIDVTVSLTGDRDTCVVVANDGAPMTENVLVNKLLTLGASGKRFQAGEDGAAQTGGFGKAKELLYFSQLSYEIRTGPIYLNGVGGEYDLLAGTDNPYGSYAGTMSTVILEGDVKDKLEGAFRRFCQLSQWKGEVYLNGERLETNLKKGHHRRDYEWAKVYTNRQFEHLVVVRINGTPMFTRYTSFEGCVIVELTGNSGDRLSANRDSLLYTIGEELDAFLVQLTVDKKSALRQRVAEYKRYEGERLKNEAKQPKAVAALLSLLGEEDQGTPSLLAAFVRGGEPTFRHAGIDTAVASAEDVQVTIGPEFILKNTTGLETPDYYQPGPAFSDYSRKLALAWAKCLVELHRILEVTAEFSIGFCLDDETGAEYEEGSYGKVYYLNPATVVSQKFRPQCRSFKAAYTGAWSGRFVIISLACHEIVHGMGFKQHDENYSSKLTEVNGIAMKHLGQLTPLFR